jgi:hypothetical protein
MQFKKTTGLRWTLRLAIFTAFFLIMVIDIRLPYVDDWQCRRIAAKLREEYGLVVRYKDPARFTIPPLLPMKTNPKIGCVIEPADRHSARLALEGVREALAKYPPRLIRQYLKAVFIPGTLKLHNIDVGGTFFESFIFVSAIPAWDYSAPLAYEQTLHHELSSIFKAGAPFPVSKWRAVNKADFTIFPRRWM